MQDKQLYEQVMGLTDPWLVERVELDVDEQRVDLWVDHQGDARWCCPECGESAPLYDHVEERVWRHLNTCQFQTLIHSRTPRGRAGHRRSDRLGRGPSSRNLRRGHTGRAGRWNHPRDYAGRDSQRPRKCIEYLH